MQRLELELLDETADGEVEMRGLAESAEPDKLHDAELEVASVVF